MTRRPPDAPRRGAFETGRREGLRDRHYSPGAAPQGLWGRELEQWLREWLRGWREGQREAREAAERGDGAPMRYWPLYGPRKPVKRESRVVAGRRVG